MFGLTTKKKLMTIMIRFTLSYQHIQNVSTWSSLYGMRSLTNKGKCINTIKLQNLTHVCPCGRLGLCSFFFNSHSLD